jgi:hypothetical protein
MSTAYTRTGIAFALTALFLAGTAQAQTPFLTVSPTSLSFKVGQYSHLRIGSLGGWVTISSDRCWRLQRELPIISPPYDRKGLGSFTYDPRAMEPGTCHLDFTMAPASPGAEPIVKRVDVTVTK